jgi:hypothetical protein
MILLSLFLLMADPVSAGHEDQVDGFRCAASHSLQSPGAQEVETAYQLRSIAIIRSGLAGDLARLNSMVATSATFTLWSGDSGNGPRFSGAKAAVAFARQLSPRAFEFSTAYSGPISTEPCALVTAEILFRGEQPNKGAIIRFQYQSGILTNVDGREVELVNGVFGPASPDRDGSTIEAR